MDFPDVLDSNRLPAHIGIIMDGNGRWARQRNQIRTQGHKEGLKTAKRIVSAARNLGISYVTLYAFSTENWKRAVEEVGFLMGLIKDFLVGEFDFYRQNGIRILHTGDMSGLPKDIQAEFAKVMHDTAGFTGMTVILAVNYGGRDELVRAIRKTATKDGISASFSEEDIRANLDNPTVPDPDLIIRTAGEKRLSNFLLWESAYSEFYFSDTLWPDWSESELIQAIASYQSRDRRYGGVQS